MRYVANSKVQQNPLGPSSNALLFISISVYSKASKYLLTRGDIFSGAIEKIVRTQKVSRVVEENHYIIYLFTLICRSLKVLLLCSATWMALLPSAHRLELWKL